MNNRIILTLGALFILLLAACTGAATESPAPAAEPAASEDVEQDSDEMMSEDDEAMDSDEAMDEHDNEMMDNDEVMMEDDETMAEHDDETMMDDDSEKMDEEMMDDDGEEMMDEETAVSANLAAWQTIPLTNAQTGEQFTFADFAGKTVFVEPMATWCSNCRRQLNDVSTATAQFDDNVVFVALSVELGISDSELVSYAEGEGYPFIFASVDETLLRELVNEFGQSVSNPPATPHFIIRADGTTTDLSTGLESADEIVTQIQAEIQ